MISDGIETIGKNAFSGCISLTDVALPDTLTAIHSYAFQDCPFEKIDIPDSVTEMSARAFYNCTNLSEIGYPAGWTTVLSLWNSTTNEGNFDARSPFEGCTSLKEITVDEGVTKIPAHAFWGVTGLETVILPESLSSIGSYAFSDCTELSQINLHESLTSVGKYVFQNCSGLKSITIPQNITVISEGLFSGCTGLSEVKLHDNITAIHSYAFQNCPFEKIDIPDSVTEISARAFYNCTNLSEIGYPAGWTTVLSIWNSTTNEGNLNAKSPFEGCTSLKEITVDEGVTKIPSHAFWGVTELETVILPKSLTSIGGYAFSGCTNLKSVNLVEGITEISSHGFAECISMNNLILPDSLETVGEYAFYKCSGLRSINMGIGLKAVKRYAFYGCHGITDLSFGGNVEEISDYAFAECINLNSVSLPSKLKTIGKAAFANCVNVSELNVPNPVISIGDDAFNGLDDLTFYCSINSYAATYAIDHNIPIIDTEENTADSNYIDSQNSYYRVNGDGVSASGYLSMVAKYGFVDSASVTDISLTFNIPAVVELDESSLTVDGVLCTNYEFKDNMLTVPVTNTGGVVRFLLKPLSYDKVTAYCKVSFNDGTSRHTEILGTVYTEIPILSITSPSQTSGTSVRVNGVTIPNSNVIIYVNGAKCTTVRSNRVGDYSANVQLTSPVNGKRYTVRAEAVDSNGVAITAETSTVYRDSVPKLEAFIMEYGGKTYNLHELAGTKPNVTWSASYRFKFTVKFENAESVSSVYIVSTRNNVKKYMEAKWNENAQAFVAEGYFDSNSHYIPGEISVQYVRNSGKVSFEEGFDFASDEVYNNLPQSWKDATITINENTDTKTDIIVDCPEDSEDMMDYALRYITEIHNIGSGYSESDAIADGYIKITDDYGKTIYYMQDCDSDSIKISTIDFGGEKDSIDVVDITIDLMTGFLDDDGDKYFESAGDVIDIIGFAGDTLDTLSDAAKIDEIKKQIQNSNMSPEEKARALEEVRRAQIANTASYLGKAALFAAGATASLSGPWGLAAAVSFMILDDLIDMWDEYFMERLLSMKFKWAIDPSGIIYDLRTGKPIVNATVTVYCVLYDENDSEFWNNKPSTDEYGELWDASEFSQQNPLQTDISGWYAWDVPEGWWRVKSEKSGYETAWSEWLPVPPPQLDVNIGMVPNAAVLGDVNNDMEINLDDVIALLRHVSKALIITDESSLSAGDVVADGKLNMDDVIKLLRYVSKAIPDLN